MWSRLALQSRTSVASAPVPRLQRRINWKSYNTLLTRSPVFTCFVFLSAFSSKSPYSPAERWTAVRLRICRPVLHPRRWRSISIETAIIHVWATDSSILQPHYGRQAGFPSFCRQSVEQSAHLISALLLAIFRQRLKTFLFRRSYLDLILWHSEVTSYCGPSSNCVIEATLKKLDDDDDDDDYYYCYYYLCTCIYALPSLLPYRERKTSCLLTSIFRFCV